MADSAAAQPAPQQVSRIRDAQYREVYSNSSVAALSPFDITITFQRMAEIVPGAPACFDQVAITFSPQHFKGLLRALTETFNAYETAFGLVKISDEDTKPLRDATQILEMINANKRAVQAAAASISSTEPRPLSKRSRAAVPK